MTQGARSAFGWGLASWLSLAFVSPSAWADPSPVDAYRVVKLETLAERRTSLAKQARGGNLLVVVMKGHWCAACAAELRAFAARRSELGRLGTSVVGLNADAPKANRGRAQVDSIPFEILSDRSTEVSRALRLWLDGAGYPMPAVVVFDRCGKEHARKVGRAPGESSVEWAVRTLQALQKKPPRCDAPNA